jgi:hypothetical protein
METGGFDGEKVSDSLRGKVTNIFDGGRWIKSDKNVGKTLIVWVAKFLGWRKKSEMYMGG